MDEFYFLLYNFYIFQVSYYENASFSFSEKNI